MFAGILICNMINYGIKDPNVLRTLNSQKPIGLEGKKSNLFSLVAR